MWYGPPATLSPAARLYVAVTLSAARKPFPLPVVSGFGSESPYALLLGLVVQVALAFPTVSDPLPLAAAKPVSPAKLAPTALAYVPALIPERLTLLSVATPLAFVVALPTELPLRVKAMVLPLTPEPAEVRVAEDPQFHRRSHSQNLLKGWSPLAS